MCYLTCFPSFVQPELERLINSLTSNDDGVGFTIATSNGQLITEHAIGKRDVQTTTWNGKDGKEHSYTKVVIDKTPMEDLCRRFVKLRKRHAEGPAMFHSRLATGGVEDTRGCHPFKLGGGMSGTVLAHNGIMFSTPVGDWRSDTRIFAEEYMPARYRKFWRNDVRERMETFLGNFNKIAIITVNPRFMTRSKGAVPRDRSAELFIFNEELGHWTEDGAWHSNSSYESFKSYRYNSYKPSSSSVTGGGWKGHGNYNNTGWVNDDDEGGAYDYRGMTSLHPQSDRDEREAKGEAYTCAYCKAIGSVDVYNEVCEVCLTCNGCGGVADACECYTPRNTTQPASIPVLRGDQVEPRAITAGDMCGYNDRPAIETTASPDERRASLLSTWWDEYDASTDPAVRHMSWEQYVTLREHEVMYDMEVMFQNIEQMEEWFAEQAALASMKDDDTRWLASVEQAQADADEAKTLAQEVSEMLGEDGDEDGIIRRLA